MDVVAALAIGFAAGVVAGMLGVGGGILFVPALTLALGLGQVEAEATSLLAIVPVAAVGAWRQRGYGNVRGRDALLLGVLAVGGAALGVVIANAVPERALKAAFSVLLVVVAAQLVRRALSDRASSRSP
jgi:uncharacterized membrane protein YfcA